MYQDHHLFINNDLPDPLKKEELINLFHEYKKGNMDARKKIIEHNIKLVIYFVKQNFYDTRLNQKDLISHGLIGLIKAVDTFDITKNIEFVTYAHKCIYTEVLQTVNKEIKRIKHTSLDDEESMHTIEATKKSSTNNIEDYNEIKHTQQILDSIRKIVENLNDFEKDLIVSYFGLNGRERIMQKDLGKKYQTTQSYITRKIQKIATKIKFELQLQGLLEYDAIVDEMIERKLPKTLYDLFPSFSTQEIDFIISKLSDEQKNILRIRHGNNYLNLTNNFTWPNEEIKSQYLYIINNMKVKLKYTFPKCKLDKINCDTFTLHDEALLKSILEYGNIYEQYPSLTRKEIEIGLLKTGAINGKYFSINYIAELYQMDSDETKRIVIKFLNSIKENMLKQNNKDQNLLIS